MAEKHMSNMNTEISMRKFPLSSATFWKETLRALFKLVRLFTLPLSSSSMEGTSASRRTSTGFSLSAYSEGFSSLSPGSEGALSEPWTLDALREPKNPDPLPDALKLDPFFEEGFTESVTTAPSAASACSCNVSTSSTTSCTPLFPFDSGSSLPPQAPWQLLIAFPISLVSDLHNCCLRSGFPH